MLYNSNGTEYGGGGREVRRGQLASGAAERWRCAGRGTNFVVVAML